jgi:hypothetical protein
LFLFFIVFSVKWICKSHKTHFNSPASSISISKHYSSLLNISIQSRKQIAIKPQLVTGSTCSFLSWFSRRQSVIYLCISSLSRYLTLFLVRLKWICFELLSQISSHELNQFHSLGIFIFFKFQILNPFQITHLTLPFQFVSMKLHFSIFSIS